MSFFDSGTEAELGAAMQAYVDNDRLQEWMFTLAATSQGSDETYSDLRMRHMLEQADPQWRERYAEHLFGPIELDWEPLTKPD
jgi:hypothetical protein